MLMPKWQMESHIGDGCVVALVAAGMATGTTVCICLLTNQNLMRFTKESMYVRINNPSMNKNVGKYHLPHIWDEALFNSSELKVK